MFLAGYGRAELCTVHVPSHAYVFARYANASEGIPDCKPERPWVLAK